MPFGGRNRLRTDTSSRSAWTSAEANLSRCPCLFFHGGLTKPLPRNPPMHDHTSATSATVNLFTADPSANGRVTTERQRIEHLANCMGLGPSQVSAVQAVM